MFNKLKRLINTWTKLRDTVYQGALDVLGTTKRKHRDWFDENDAEAATILRKMHESHLQWINDRESAAKADTYRHHKQSAQGRLRAMKEQWWSDRATELQEAADRKNAKLFYDGLKAIYGPQANGSTSILSAGAETRLTEPSRILERWAEHFSDVLNRSSTISQAAIDNIAQRPLMDELAQRPTLDETTAAIKNTFQWKSSRTRCDCCRNLQVRWNKPHKEPCKAIQQYLGQQGCSARVQGRNHCPHLQKER